MTAPPPPLVLDLFCCEGGASQGYADAGFRVIGVDKEDRPGYPFEMVKVDALDVLREMATNGGVYAWRGTYGGLTFIRPDLIHASCPCQKACTLTTGTNGANGWGGEHEQLVPQTRELLDATGIPYVIEQPTGHGGLIRTDLWLCMDMFYAHDYPPPWVQRHRDFEISGFTVAQPWHPKHRGYVRGWRGRHGNTPGFFRDGPYVAAYGSGGGKATDDEMRHALQMPWATCREALTEAIPPAYAAHIGRGFLRQREHWTTY